MIGLDTARSVFQIHGVNETGKVEIRRKLRRSDLIAFFEKQERCTVVMEACGAAHHWARILTGLGHTVKLIAAEAVKPFVRNGKKNDAADAAAICEAASRPNATFVPVKSVAQQGILALHTARSVLVRQQTMLANAIRGLATEFGHVVPKGLHNLGQLVDLVDADEAMPEQARQAIAALHERFGELANGIQAFEVAILAHARSDAMARRLATIPGIGPITASLIAATVVDISRFKTARQFAAWPGAAAELDRRQDPPGPDHQSGQPRDPPVAGAGGNVDARARRRLAQRGWWLAAGYPTAPPGQAGDGGAGQPDGAYRVGGDDAQ
jgi:error-prone DNA polymerase